MQSKNCPPIRILFIFICLLISVVAVPRVGVNVGLTPNTDFIASDGVVQQSWQNGQESINQYIEWQDFFLSMTAGVPQTFSALVSVYNASVTGVAIEKSQSGSISPSQQVILRLHFSCRSTASTLIDLRITLSGFDDLFIQFAKECKTNAPRTDFFVSTDSNFSVPANVVANGMVLAPWNSSSFITDAGALTFYVWVASGSQDFAVISDRGDDTIIAPDITSGLVGTAYPASNTLTNISITCALFNCQPVDALAFASLSLAIDPFDPVSFSWQVRCKASMPSPQWSKTAAAIALVVLFCAGACVCVAVYRKNQGYSGIYVMPCYDLLCDDSQAEESYREMPHHSEDPLPPPVHLVRGSIIGPQAQFDHTHGQLL